MYQSVFERYELKYMLTKEQLERTLAVMAPYMRADSYGKTTIRNLYFDTDTYLLIRRSIEKPIYKEKLRLRSYKLASHEDTVFAEIKRKYNGIVYKRRVALTESKAIEWLCSGGKAPENTQISREIDYFKEHYGGLHSAVFLSYDREAYYSLTDDSFRVTFDKNILARDTDLSLCAKPYGMPLLEDGTVLMEIKCAGGIPLWMTSFLSKEKIYKTSFSKYGEAYRKIIYPKLKKQSNKEDVCYALCL